MTHFITNQDIETHLVALRAGIERLRRISDFGLGIAEIRTPQSPIPNHYTLLIDGERLSQPLPYIAAAGGEL